MNLASVSGGWSEWSEWTPCNRTNSLNGTDECLCSMRVCNNPTPQNTGADCEGSPKKVLYR